MRTLEQLLESIPEFLPLIIVTFLVLISLRLIQWLWLGRKFNAFSDHKIVPQSLMLVSGFVGFVMIVLALPISDVLRGQILSLLGLVLTGVMALSSTTFVANAFAGTMLRLTRSFRVGDYIRVNEMGGRVSERGIFHTEIQTEDRDLTTFPNLYLITNPVTVVRVSGTIISAKISLGYDLDHSRIETLLAQAASNIHLKDPYVHVLELGDYSITYKVCGYLEDVKVLLTTRSRLKKSILDTLHKANVEIVSPSFMNQRPLKANERFIPQNAKRSKPTKPVGNDFTAENIVFDKAETAQAEAQQEEDAAAKENDPTE